MTMEPTYFLYSGKLFHESALPFLTSMPNRGEDAPETPVPPPRRGEGRSATAWQPRRGEDPGPGGPEEEPVGDDDAGADDDDAPTTSQPAPGPGMPMVPDPGSPDANPIDPRVF